MNFKNTAAAAVCLLTFIPFIPGGMNAGAYTAVSADIPVTCLDISGKDYTCEVTVEPEKSDCPMPEPAVLEINSSGSGSFRIDITEPGTYTYKVCEKPGTDPGINYDESIYTVTVFVEHADNNELAYSVSASRTKSSYKSKTISFTNEPVTEATVPETTEELPTGDIIIYKREFTTDPDEDTETSEEAATTSADKGETDTSEKKNTPIKDIISDVITGDSFPAHAVRGTMIAAVVTAAVTFLIKRRGEEEEDDDNE